MTVDDQVVPAASWRRERGAAVVKLLAVSPGHRLHREQMMEQFWPELDRDAAGANLRKAVHFARRSLGAPDLLVLDGDVVALAPSAELVLDTERFAAAAKDALSDSTSSACTEAADLYGGELLPDDRYVEWLEEPRQQLHQRYVRVLRAGKLWDRLIAADPTDEQAQCALMQTALDAGNRGEAIRLFQQLRDRLRVDLGVGPSKAAVALYERAIQAPATLAVDVTDRVRASLAWGLIHLHSGELAKAEQIARDSRQLAVGAGLAREIGETSALLGIVAHMQGKWPTLFRSEFIEWVRTAPSYVTNVLDGHLCLAEFCLASPTGPGQLGGVVDELLSVAETAGSVGGRGLATMVLGDLALIGGRIDDAERLLCEAEQLHTEAGSAAGRVFAIERLGNIALARGQKWRARKLVEKASGIVEGSWLVPHAQLRLLALTIAAAAAPEEALEAVRLGDRGLASGALCQPCSMGFRAASAIALAEAGEIDHVGRRLDEAERLAGMWSGGPWVAALWEARGVLRRAQGNEQHAATMFGEAAARYGELGRPLDQARCLRRV